MTLCPICNGTSFPLGQLGEYRWYRCRACGYEHHSEDEEDFERELEDAQHLEVIDDGV